MGARQRLKGNGLDGLNRRLTRTGERLPVSLREVFVHRFNMQPRHIREHASKKMKGVGRALPITCTDSQVGAVSKALLAEALGKM